MSSKPEITPQMQSHFIQVDELRIHYREVLPFQETDAPPILLLHGFPTSSLLWRNIMPVLGRKQRVIAVDLPGYGESDKPLNVSYSFRYYQRFLDRFLDSLGLAQINLVVHDTGGPIGAYWAVHRTDRVRQLAMLNTLVFSDFSWAVMAFLFSCKLPGIRSLLASPWGLKTSLYLGMNHHEKVDEELIQQIQTPFTEKRARKALLKAGVGLTPAGFKDLEKLLAGLTMPVGIFYGAKDLILPDMPKTAERLIAMLPDVSVVSLPECGHFLQEDDPEQVSALLADFFEGTQSNGISPEEKTEASVKGEVLPL
ncbi:alpha/beta fold hydrolase [Hahella ganghwensis]|uniref:alpha/beta fold hydrolase n=1 Tax=Hahella ganghwensis TaxID=286420 RepID=UPI0003656DFE|nr:alpha/beta fold hydrolase [Hahella ganghwensis]